ncbi:hypothetical protein HZB00_01050 [Candidatus Woesearchaeota archaeon]|nr:hypothetical protein [Candidatus Woesearchaeota archaeon]
MWNKKAGVGEVPEAPLLFIGLILIIVVFSILFFVLGGASPKEAVISPYIYAQTQNTVPLLNLLETPILLAQDGKQQSFLVKDAIVLMKKDPAVKNQLQKQLEEIIQTLPETDTADWYVPIEKERPVAWKFFIDNEEIAQTSNQQQGHDYSLSFAARMLVPNPINPEQPIHVELSKRVN